MRVRPCDKCGTMADVSRKKQIQTVFCPKCKHKTIKHIIIKGRGG